MIHKFISFVNESLPRESSLRQLKSLRSKCKGTDIGDRISDMNKQGGNIEWIHNPIDNGIESYEGDQEKNKDFVTSWNLKHLNSPWKKGSNKK